MRSEWRKSTLILIYKNKGIFKTVQITLELTHESHYETLGKSD